MDDILAEAILKASVQGNDLDPKTESIIRNHLEKRLSGNIGDTLKPVAYAQWNSEDQRAFNTLNECINRLYGGQQK